MNWFNQLMSLNVLLRRKTYMHFCDSNMLGVVYLGHGSVSAIPAAFEES